MPPQSLLFLTESFPLPPVGARRARDLGLLHTLADLGVGTTLLHFSRQGRSHREKGPVSGLPHSVRSIPVRRSPPRFHQRVGSLFKPRLLSGICPRMLAELRHLHRLSIARTDGEPPVLWVSRLEMAPYVPLARRLGFRIVLDVHHFESQRMLDRFNRSLTALPGVLRGFHLQWFEKRYCGMADAVVAASEQAAARLRRHVDASRIFVVSTGVFSERLAPLRKAPGDAIVIPGNFARRSDMEGLDWLLDEIIPRLRARFRENAPRFRVMGPGLSPEDVVRLRTEGIEVHADPDTSEEVLRGARMIALPLRSGDAAHLRILEAMAAGRPVVTTGQGAAGLPIAPSIEALLADQPDRFAQGLCDLWTDSELHGRLSSNAIRMAEERYDWKSQKKSLQAAIQFAAAAPGLQLKPR